jgi:hypothetical protein
MASRHRGRVSVLFDLRQPSSDSSVPGGAMIASHRND